MKYRILWCHSATFEQEWITKLLEGIDYELIQGTDTSLLPLALPLPDVLIVNSSVDYEALCAHMATADADHPFGVIHLSDETLGNSMNYLNLPSCRFAFRNYWHPVHSLHPKVTTFGLGWKKGFAAQTYLVPKIHAWSFAGCIHHETRKNTILAFKEVTPNAVRFISSFNSADGLDVDTYRSLVSSSMFVPCPIGHGNIDSFRLYEVLEGGAIPIAVRSTSAQPCNPSYWSLLFDEVVPFPMVHREEDWNNAADLVQKMWNNPDAYKELLSDVQQFWSRAKKKWNSQLITSIGALRSYSN